MQEGPKTCTPMKNHSSLREVEHIKYASNISTFADGDSEYSSWKDCKVSKRVLLHACVTEQKTE